MYVLPRLPIICLRRSFLHANSPGRTFLWCPPRPGDLLPFLPSSLFFLSSFFLFVHLLRLSHHESHGADCPSCLRTVSQAAYRFRFESRHISLIPSPIYFVIFAVLNSRDRIDFTRLRPADIKMFYSHESKLCTGYATNLLLGIHVFQQELTTRSHLPSNHSPHVPETWCCYSMVSLGRRAPSQ